MSSRSKENVHILFESVFAIYDFWDGPRTGIAEFMNAPHFFECVFDQDKDEWSNSFFLIPLGPEAFVAGMDTWNIFLRWRAAFDAGKTSLDTHPALPEDRTKYEESSRILKGEISSGRGNLIQRLGQFEHVEKPDARGLLASWRVRWSGPPGK
jgi:hypothetical protein